MSLRKQVTTADEYFVELITTGGLSNMDAYLMSHPEYAKRKKETNQNELCLYIKAPKILDLVEQHRKIIRERSVMTAEYMLEKLREFVDDESVRTADKIKSMELAGKLQGMYLSKIQHSGGVEVSHNITPEMAEAVDELLR